MIDPVIEMSNSAALDRSASDRTVLRLRVPDDQRLIITIDGPAGTGKSTVARRVAQRLGLAFLDTGAMYRAAAAITLDRGIDPNDHAAVVEAVRSADLHFDWSTDPPAMLAWGAPVNGRLRDADVTAMVSIVAAIGALREHMVRKQRLIGQQHPRLVTEGRDQGSVVFPDAAVRFFLDAAPGVRARRRAEQLREAGRQADEPRLLAEIIERDRLDAQRADGPLICPTGAIVIDTSALTLDEVIDRLVDEVRARVRLE